MKPPPKRVKSMEVPKLRQFNIVLTDCMKKSEIIKPVPKKLSEKPLEQLEDWSNGQHVCLDCKSTNVYCGYTIKNGKNITYSSVSQ